MNITILKIALLFQDLPWLYYCVYLYYIFVLLYKLSHKYINILYAYIITHLEHVFVCDQQTLSQVISYQLTATYLSSLICHGPCCFLSDQPCSPIIHRIFFNDLCALRVFDVFCVDSCRVGLYTFHLWLWSWAIHRSWVLLSLNFLLVCRRDLWLAGTHVYLCVFSTYDLIRVLGIEYHRFHGQCSACHSWSTFDERKNSFLNLGLQQKGKRELLILFLCISVPT